MGFKLKATGIWGYRESNVTSGYVNGEITKGRYARIFKGIWKTIDNSSVGKVVGIMKRGYFNGHIIKKNESKIPITGIYRINRENRTITMTWLTPTNIGWIVVRLERENRS